jgi:hypothetical protein
MKDNIQSARLAGLEAQVLLWGFIQETDFAKANPVMFRLSI